MVKRGLLGLLLTLVVFANVAFAAVVPVGDFFKDPEFTSVTLSPTGEYITVASPIENKTVLNAFRVSDMKRLASWELGDRSPIGRVVWVNDNRFLLLVNYREGRFDYNLSGGYSFAVNVDGTQRTELPNALYFQIVSTLRNDDKNILISRSAPDAYLYKLNVYTGKSNVVASAPLRPGNFLVDENGEVKYVTGGKEGTKSYVLRRDGSSWKQIAEFDMGEGTQSPIGMTPDGKSAYFEISDKGEPSRISTIDPETSKETVLIPSQTVDPEGVVRSSDGKEILMVFYQDGLPEYKFVNKNHPEARTYASLINSFSDQGRAVQFRGISKDGDKILMNVFSDVDPGSYYLFDRSSNKATFLVSSMDWIKPDQMSEMMPIAYKARDGVTIHGYLTLPKDAEHRNLPLILHPHGGPHGPRDEWGFNPEVQYLANLGYAVLQVNFRGSGGYGNAFEKMGYRNWGLKMIDDMTDGVRWAVSKGYADPKRVCTYGASYGGYAALQSVVREQGMYKCAIGYVGMYNMDLWLSDSDVAKQKSGRAYQDLVFPTERGARNAQSAGFNIDKINVPVMLVHGAKDPRVPISQYDFLKEELEKACKPPEVTVVEKDEGHGFYANKAQMNLYPKMAAFLRKHLGPTPNNP